MSCRTKENRSSQGCQQPHQAELPPHSGACHSCCPESVVSRHGRVRGWGAWAKGASGDLRREWEAQQKQERPQQRGEGRTADGCPGGRGRDAALARRCPGIRLLGSSGGPVKTRTSQKWLLSWSFTPLRFLFFLLLYSLFLLSFFACAEAEEGSCRVRTCALAQRRLGFAEPPGGRDFIVLVFVATDEFYRTTSGLSATVIR